MIRKNVFLTNENSEIIRAETYSREDAKEAPTIIVCHGFKGFKNWAFFPAIAETLAGGGYFVVTFNFSRNGIGPGLNNFTELDKFEQNTYSLELSDLQRVLDAISNGEIGGGIADPELLGLLGHSRGGGISILHASVDRRIKVLVTWAAIATVHRYSDEQISEWQKVGYLEFENKRTKQIMRVGTELLRDIKKNSKKLDILNAAGKLEIPALILHGDSDESVPIEEASLIYDHLKTNEKELTVIEDGAHTFGASHPLESIPETLETVFDLTENWFDQYLK